MSKDKSARTVITDPARLSFPAVPPHKPQKDEDTGRETWGTTFLLPPGTDLQKYRDALKAAMVEKFGPDTAKWPSSGHKPTDVIRDFEAYNNSRKKPLPGNWKGWTMIRANASVDYPPGVVGPVKDLTTNKFPAITDRREVYGGRWAKGQIEAYYFDHKKKTGVTFGLKNVQLLKHDAPFSGAVTAPEDAFTDADGEWAGDGDAFTEQGPATEKNTGGGDGW